jgi:hypothetical protein
MLEINSFTHGFLYLGDTVHLGKHVSGIGRHVRVLADMATSSLDGKNAT